MDPDYKRNLNKTKYKIYLLVLEYIPIIVALILFSHIVLGYFGINAQALMLVGGFSFIPMLFILIASSVLRFCSTHRIPIYYCMTDEALALLDYYFEFDVVNIYGIYFIIAFIFIMLYTYCHIKFGLRV